MSVSDARSTARRHVVAVGPTREDAAAPFGLDHSDLFLTSYADLSVEVDLDDVDSVDLAAGEGLYTALDLLCPRLDQDPDFTLRVEYSFGTHTALADALERNSVAIAEVQSRAGSLLLVLESAERTSDTRTHTILSAIDAATAATGPTGAGDPAGHHTGGAEEPTSPAGAPANPTPRQGPPNPKRPRPRLLDLLNTTNRWRSSRRRRAAAVLALAVLAMALLALGLLSGSSEPVVVVLLVLLVLLGLGATGLLFMTVLVLARQVNAQTGRIERMLLRNRTIVQRRTTAIERSTERVGEGQRRLPFMQEYLEAMAAASSTSSANLTDQIQSLRTEAVGLHLDTQRQVQAALNLHDLLDIKDRVPPLGGWAASADFNVLMLQELIHTRPRTVVECGSGTSTLLIALAVRQYGLSTRVVALEHLEEFKAQTERILRQHGVAELAEVRLAQLAPTSLPDHPTPWYAEEALAGLDEIGLLVVDGPPEATGARSRYPAVPLLCDHLAGSCVIVVDDLVRPADLEVVQSWRPLLPDFDYEQLNTFQKRVGVFRRQIGQPALQPEI